MKTKTSWNQVGDWYNKIVGTEGHYYHDKIILPNVIRLMKLKEKESVLDLGCGQGVFSRAISKEINYTGVDIAPGLIEEAKGLETSSNHRFVVGDIEGKLETRERFDWATIILAIQNVKSPFKVFKNAFNLLKDSGQLLIVLNHPAFRIPKNSDWLVQNNKQYRIVETYLTPLEIPIESSPYNKKNNQKTFSFHYPLSAYVEMLTDNGFLITAMEEWSSDKKSTGPMATIEDNARKEIPLFLTIVARKSLVK